MDKKLFFILLFIAATGLTTGSFFEIYMSGEGKDQLMGLLSGFFGTGGSGLSFFNSFWQNISGSFLFLLLCYLSPVIPILVPLNLIFLFSRGFFFGFSAAMLMETFASRGLLYVSLTLAPSALLLTLLFSLLLSLSMQEGKTWMGALLNQHGHRGTPKRKAPLIFAGPYLYCYAAGLGALILICLLQTFLLQAVT